MKKVSIIIPVSAGAGSPDELITSLEQQTLYRETETIVVKSSTEVNSLAGLIQTGLEKANAGYVCVLKAGDDLASEAALEKLYLLAEEKDADCILTECEEQSAQVDEGLYTELTDNEKISQLYGSKSIYSGLYKKDCLNNLDYTYRSGNSASDEEVLFWQIIINAKKIISIRKPLFFYENSPGDSALSYEDPDSIFEVNKRYDFIRNYLLDYYKRDIWETFKLPFIENKLASYLSVLQEADGNLRRSFWERFAREIKRSIYLEEIPFERLAPEHKVMVKALLEYPEDYYSTVSKLEDENKSLLDERASLYERNMILQSRVEALENSTTFKVGSILTYLPRQVKTKIKQKY